MFQNIKKKQKNTGIFEKSLAYVLKNMKFMPLFCSPASEHLAIKRTRSNKIHVLVEKPLFDKPIEKKNIII